MENSPKTPTPPKVKKINNSAIPPVPKISKIGNKSGEFVSMSKLAHLMGVTPRTIKNWVMDGMPCEENSHGKSWLFDSAACFKWKLEKEVSDVRKQYEHLETPEQISVAQIKIRTLKATMHREELKLEKEAGEVIAIQDAIVNFSAVLNEIRAKLVSFSSRRSGMLAHQEQEDVEKIIDEEVSEILEAITDYEHSYVE